MAKLSEENFRAAVQPHLQPGERLVHVAYGVKQPNLFVIVLLTATIGGALAIGALTKHYVLALTDRRLLIVQVQGGLFGVNFATKALTEYSFSQLAALPIKTSVGGIFTHVRVDGPSPFVAKFHRLATKTNREHSAGIAQALEAIKANGAPRLAGPAPGGYGAPAALPPGGYGAPAALPPGGYGAPAAPPGGYGAPAAPPGHGAPQPGAGPGPGAYGQGFGGGAPPQAGAWQPQAGAGAPPGYGGAQPGPGNAPWGRH